MDAFVVPAWLFVVHVRLCFLERGEKQRPRPLGRTPKADLLARERRIFHGATQDYVADECARRAAAPAGALLILCAGQRKNKAAPQVLPVGRVWCVTQLPARSRKYGEEAVVWSNEKLGLPFHVNCWRSHAPIIFAANLMTVPGVGALTALTFETVGCALRTDTTEVSVRHHRRHWPHHR